MVRNNNPAYTYNEGIDMILLPYTRQEDSATGKEEYDFKHMLWYCLDDIMNQGINLISFMKKRWMWLVKTCPMRKQRLI